MTTAAHPTGGSWPLAIVVALLVGVAAAALYAALTVYTGFIGLGGLAAGAVVGLAVGYTAPGPSRAPGVVAAVVTLLACFAGEIGSMMWAGGIPLTEVLGPRRQAALNTMFNLFKLLVYAFSCWTAYSCAGRGRGW